MGIYSGISDSVQLALIVAIPAMMSPLLLAWLTNRAALKAKAQDAELRRTEKSEEWRRQDEVAAKLLIQQELAATRAAEAAAKAAEAVEISKVVAVKVDGLLADRDKQNVREGEQRGKAAGEEAARQLAEGQRQGRESEREGVASAKVVMTASADQPIPVTDDRVAVASERVAVATEAATKATERVADEAEKKK